MATRQPMRTAKFNPGGGRNDEGCANQNAIDEADEELPTKIGDDVAVDLQENVGDFVFEGRITKRQVIFPTSLDGGPLLKKEKQINRHQDQAQKKTGDAEKPANAFLDDRPDFLSEVGQLFFKVRQLFFHQLLKTATLGIGQLRRSGRNLLQWRGGGW